MNVAYRIPLLAGLTTGIIVTASPSHAQSDDFNDNNADGWTEFNPIGIASFSATGGTYRIASPASPNPGLYGPARAAALRQDVDDYESFCVMVDIVAYDEPQPDEDVAIGVMARVQRNPAAGETRGYTFTYQPRANDVQISRIKNEEPTFLGPGEVLSSAPGQGTTLRMVFFGHRNYFEGRIYDTSDLLNPLAIAIRWDDSGEGYNSGVCGLVVSDFSENRDQPIDATFDNYSANDGTPPPLVITKNGTGAVTLTWPDSGLCWQLQTSTDLDPDSWFDVFTGITHQANDGTFSLAETFAAGGPERFWRWWIPED